MSLYKLLQQGFPDNLTIYIFEHSSAMRIGVGRVLNERNSWLCFRDASPWLATNSDDDHIEPYLTMLKNESLFSVTNVLQPVKDLPKH